MSLMLAPLFLRDAMLTPLFSCRAMLTPVRGPVLSAVHNTELHIPKPCKIPTPYGGRLVWRLPGGNTLTAHLKDKAKIRHRKRWSQVG